MARHSSLSAPAEWPRRRSQSAQPRFLCQALVFDSLILSEIDRANSPSSIDDSGGLAELATATRSVRTAKDMLENDMLDHWPNDRSQRPTVCFAKELF